ncbi:MAG: inorganic diphosphatase [Clostridiales bacterium]|jgi:inorganic pyrophosphatase|nr:inorganic diphosphatase [Clostridiales bacterium]
MILNEHDPTYAKVRDISALPEHVFDEMRHFFSVYKQLENKDTVVDDVAGREEAVGIIKNAIDNYLRKFSRRVGREADSDNSKA